MKKIYFFLFLLCCAGFSSAQRITSPDFFPISVWLQAPYDVQTYKNMGINNYVGLDYGNLDASQLATLNQYHMYVLPSVGDTFALHHISDTLIWGWLNGDEPDNAQWNATTKTYDSCIDPQVIIHQYDSIKLYDSIQLKDPALLVYFGLGQGVSNTTYVGRGPCYDWLASYPVYDNGYLKGNDIGGYDIYPVNNGDSTLWEVAKGVDSLLLWSSIKASQRTPSGKPIWMSIETTDIDATQGPTPAQTKAEVWMAIIHGAKGINYFCDWFSPSFLADAVLRNSAMVSTITSVDSMIHALAPVINSSNTGYATNTNANTPGVSSSNGTVPVNYMTKTYNGSTYVFAEAMRNRTTTATFTVAGSGSATVLGEGRTIPISGGKFSDNFSPFGVHLYKFSSLATAINEADAATGIRIYPNPFSNSTSIVFTEGGVHHLALFDITGRKLISWEFTGTQYKLFKNDLSAGIYFIKVYDSQQNYISISKIVVQ